MIHRPRRPRSIAMLAALLLAACDSGPDVTHYVLALSWQPAFCELNARRPECRDLDSADFAADNLTIHGLWPNDAPGSGPSYCAVDASTKVLDQPQSWCELPEPKMSAKTRTALTPAMPGTASCLDRHEWIKHGTCSGLDADRYFANTLRLAKEIQATRLGEVIAANVGRNVTPQQLRNAFETAFGVGSSKALTLVCTEHGSRSYLAELRIALAPSALKERLEHNNLFLEAEAPPGDCPDTIRIDSAGP